MPPSPSPKVPGGAAPTLTRTAPAPARTRTRARTRDRTIEKLRTDNYKLKDELFLENKYSSLPSNSAVTTQISKLQDQADVFTRKIEIEKRRVAELDKQIAKMHDRIMLQRTKMGGINAARENNLQIQKQIKILENRLEKALVKYNESIAHNKQLRESIDNLRRERLVFDQIYKKLEKELRRKEKEMSNIVEISNQAYEARDQARLQVPNHHVVVALPVRAGL